MTSVRELTAGPFTSLHCILFESGLPHKDDELGTRPCF